MAVPDRSNYAPHSLRSRPADPPLPYHEHPETAATHAPTMSSLKFAPPLQSRTVISIPADASSVAVSLRAHITSDTARKFRANGTVVQVWSNMPTENDSGGAEWSAHALQARTAFPHASFRLSTDNPDDDGDSELAALIILPNTAPASYSFTYRLAFPGGELTWLGQPHENAVLEITPGPGTFSEQGAWITAPDVRRNFVAESDGPFDVVVGRFIGPCSFWAFDGFSTTHLQEHRTLACHFRALIALPTPTPSSPFQPYPLILQCVQNSKSTAASVASYLSLSPTGDVTLLTQPQNTNNTPNANNAKPSFAQPVVEYWTFDPHAPSNKDAARLRDGLVRAGAARVLAQTHDALVLAPAGHSGNAATRVAMIPLAGERASVPVRVSAFAQLGAGVESCVTGASGGAGAGVVCLFCEKTNRAVFVRVPSTAGVEKGQEAGGEEERITLCAEKDGEEVIVCPAYEMHELEEEEEGEEGVGRWLVALPTIRSQPTIVYSGAKAGVKRQDADELPPVSVQSAPLPPSTAPPQGIGSSAWTWVRPLALAACMLREFCARAMRMLWWVSGAPLLVEYFAPPRVVMGKDRLTESDDVGTGMDMGGDVDRRGEKANPRYDGDESQTAKIGDEIDLDYVRTDGGRHEAGDEATASDVHPLCRGGAFRWDVPADCMRLSFLLHAPPGSSGVLRRVGLCSSQVPVRVMLGGKEVRPVCRTIGEGTMLFEVDRQEGQEGVLEIGMHGQRVGNGDAGMAE